MRYINRNVSPKYCSEANCMLEQDCMSSDIDYLDKALSKAIDGSSSFEIRLSGREKEMMRRLLHADEASRALRQSPRTGGGEDYTSEYDNAVKTRMDVMAELSKRSVARAETINSESVYFGPDGKPVSQEDASQVGRARLPENVEPRMVDDPMSALDILSHNAAVSRMRVEAETPRTGQDAVLHRGSTPGMPVFTNPASHSQDREGDSMNTKYRPMTSRSDELVSDAESRNYGRK